MKYQNTQDLGTIARSVCCRKPKGHNNLRKTDLLEIRELENWMMPRLKPSLWKKYLWKEQYLKEHLYNNALKDSFFSGKLDTCKGISKENFLRGVIEELREGNKEVNELTMFY